MKRMFVLLAVLALTLSLFAGCGRYGAAGDGSNVSTTDNGYVNGTNPEPVPDTVPGTDYPAGTNAGTGMGDGAVTGNGMGSDAV